MQLPYDLMRVDGSEQAKTLEALHTLCLPADEQEDYSAGHWWIVYYDGEPVAFAGMREAPSFPGAVYFSRVGVLPAHRGKGLQARCMAAIHRKAKALGYETVISTTFDNPASANNFIRCGYRMYLPALPWGAVGTCYWRRDLTK